MEDNETVTAEGAELQNAILLQPCPVAFYINGALSISCILKEGHYPLSAHRIVIEWTC